MTPHLCNHCVSREVTGEFAYPDGSGFCSAKCYHDANTEFAEWQNSQPEEVEEVPTMVWGSVEDFGYFGVLLPNT
jgi:hypothetical protein